MLQHCTSSVINVLVHFTARTHGDVLQALSACVPQCCKLQLHCTVLHELITPRVCRKHTVCVCVNSCIALSFCYTQTSSVSDHGSLQLSIVSEEFSSCLYCRVYVTSICYQQAHHHVYGASDCDFVRWCSLTSTSQHRELQL